MTFYIYSTFSFISVIKQQIVFKKYDCQSTPPSKASIFLRQFITGLGIWSFTHSLFCSKSLILKSNCEQFAHVDLYKRANCSCCSLKKSNVSDLLEMRANHSQKASHSLKKLTVFPLFYAQEWIAPVTLGSVAFILRATWAFCSRRSLQKERPWAIRSDHSWQKSNRSDSLFFTSESLFHSQKNERIARKTDERIPNPGSFFLFPSTQSLLPPSIKIKHI